MARGYDWLADLFRRQATIDVRQGDRRRLNFRVLVTSLTLALIVAILVYLGWYLLATPTVAPT
jgi:hypothetical protein